MEEMSKERLSVIKGTPYFISDDVLRNDLKWLIGQAEQMIHNQDSIKIYQAALKEIIECHSLEEAKSIASNILKKDLQKNDKVTIIEGEYKGQNCYVMDILLDGTVKVTPLWGYFIVKQEQLAVGWITVD